ncbi:hypothetical protein [Deinococcus enclensis]|uniref:DUF4390 domain-containing protein n=1 Tax=Deinococcus enclensis TaxID=1049582 RepID=A0ABT9MD02_9DEIO|nr:hypothetical protein [Deinococcus enclensis]MDP9764460.1 hypothetical protein [Deinococcus enclensis]
MFSGLAFGCLPTTVWARDVVFTGEELMATKVNAKGPSTPNGPLRRTGVWLQKTRLDLSHVLTRKPYLHLFATTERREKLELLAPRLVGLTLKDDWRIEMEVDLPYVNDLEAWRQRLRAGSVTSLELLETGQMASFLPYLQLLGDWQALNVYFAGLLKINVGLALLLRDKVRELQQCELGAWLKRTEWIPQPESLARPRPPTAPLAPPTLNGLA